MSVLLAHSRDYDYYGGLPGPAVAFIMNSVDLAALLDKKRNVMRINSCCTVFCDLVVFGLMVVTIVVGYTNAFPAGDWDSSRTEIGVSVAIFGIAIALTALQLVLSSIGFADCFADFDRHRGPGEEWWVMRRQQQFQRRTMPRYA
ncbi:Hypothetical protein D9617_19g102580 [Elsinoe fawcettii]|nr:Hypothetical protein D9617_19g102580 [Elsinoe fawcettii]